MLVQVGDDHELKISIN